MSSGFVSAGTNEQPVERDAEWLKVQQEIEDERRRKAEVGKQNDGKSLYEVLQQNKMAKQEQFEEKTRLKNQFRSLDEDEVDFLDSVLESTRAQEATIKRDTADQLEEFRKQREEAEKAHLGPTSSDVTPAEEEEWTIPARKRRRERKDLLLPGKKRKASTTAVEKGGGKQATHDEAPASDTTVAKHRDSTQKPSETNTPVSKGPSGSQTSKTETAKASAQNPIPPSQPPKPSAPMGLVSYDSDSE